MDFFSITQRRTHIVNTTTPSRRRKRTTQCFTWTYVDIYIRHDSRHDLLVEPELDLNCLQCCPGRKSAGELIWTVCVSRITVILLMRNQCNRKNVIARLPYAVTSTLVTRLHLITRCGVVWDQLAL